MSRVRQRLDLGPRVQIFPDLHLEVGQQYSTFNFPISAPFLLLAGDIGRLIDYATYRGFLETQVARCRKVFVLGNHKFYGMDYRSGLDAARRLAEEPSLAARLVLGLVLLHHARWDDPDSDLTIIGSTLWSHSPEDAYGIVEAKVKDFQKIQHWTVQQHTAIHAEEATWLREQVGQVNEGEIKRRLLVATHHAPCIEGTSRPKHASNPWTPAFATDLVDQRGWEGARRECLVIRIIRVSL